MAERKHITYMSVAVAAHRTRLAERVVRRCVQMGLVRDRLTEAELTELRRVKRLSELGINMAGIEVVFRMRRQIEELQAERTRLQAQVESLVSIEKGD
jgi:DNA-binding transcriptional MerR regulator